jgi:hypothetical protein
MCVVVPVKRGPVQFVITVAVSQSKDAVSGAESAVANLQVQPPQQRRETIADDALCFFHHNGRGRDQSGQPVKQACLVGLQELRSSAVVEAPVSALSGSLILAGPGRGNGCHPRNKIEIFASYGQCSNSFEHCVVVYPLHQMSVPEIAACPPGWPS